ncbi:DUF4908 domain-containing protein [Brevundimonas sp.]|uniref:DUF4908 domain-containing protein n=1 Tax=Brevundimonas sp. TaxID=1871086 RepID=UPI0025D93130|nr:DUF4908 domain-containing protein [Brevundimonas sp.]
MLDRVRIIAALAAMAVACQCGGWLAPAPAYARDRLVEIRATFVLSISQDSPSFRDRLFGRDGRDEAPAVARFTSQGGPAFTLDQSGARPLLRFDGSNEIWALRPSAGVRGDVYYRNDVGEVVLRQTRLGGLTLYTRQSPGGLPCAVAGAARPLRMQDHSVTSLFRHMLRETARGGSAMEDRLFIEAQEVSDESAAIVGDAVTVAVDGIVRLAQTQTGHERLNGLREIQIVFGSSPGVSRTGSRLIITVAPRLGPAGRPSSARVMRALMP